MMWFLSASVGVRRNGRSSLTRVFAAEADSCITWRHQYHFVLVAAQAPGEQFVSSLAIWFSTWLFVVLQPELSEQYFYSLYYIECMSTKYMVRTSPLRRIAEVAATTMTLLWLREHGPACV